VVMACINPHRFGLSSALESELAVEVECASIGGEHVLVKAVVASHESPHKFGADATPLILGMNEKMRVINNEVAVGNGIAEADKSLAVPCGENGVRAEQGAMQQVGLLGR